MDANKQIEQEKPQHVKRVFIDPSISANIIGSRVVEKLGLQDQIVPAVRVLNGFNMACETMKGEITLSVITAGTNQEKTFYVIEEDMRYNALFERPWVYNMRVVPSTLRQALKFPTSGGVKMIYGELPTARELFVVDEVIPAPAISTSKSTEPTKKEETK
ncbi:uncharacterized protein [Nicotiana tomentosiformis]|uniref:uncharacterized protein n=1 Tax=Nicotiana tomentosiformis TaxID=4098 RepID=UPI00388C380F